ncbi:MAG: Holliday junction branch migration protein RuvA [Deltaproteobacteria bacterium]|nr:Holliday junction branch migration protein RuvA [Deltaproteobacteria bacterium]
MIAHLKGLLSVQSTESIVVDVSGVGYEVFVSAKTQEQLKNFTNPISILIYTHVREDQITLFGFLSPLEKKLFLKLLSVSGIGPKVALNIMSGMVSEDLITAIHREDLARLTAISGVGKKTAERIILELKDKLLKITDLPQLEKTSTLSLKSTIEEDLLSALTNLGYPRNTVEKTLEVMNKDEKDDFENALKIALKHLSKN